MATLDESQKLMSTVHYLPCTIDYNGPVPVNSFLQIKKLKNNELKSAFRGRELVGKEIELHKGVIGVNAVQNSHIDKTESSWECVGQFEKIIVWQHDIAPDLSVIQDCVDWFDIANNVSLNLLSLLLYERQNIYSAW